MMPETAVSQTIEPFQLQSMSPPTINISSIRQVHSTSLDTAIIVESLSLRDIARTFVAGRRFGNDSGDGAVARKGADTGAYPDKSGEYKDVMDLLDSAEVKTYKKLGWGGTDARMYRGFIKVLFA